MAPDELLSGIDVLSEKEALALGIIGDLGFVNKDIYKRINKQILQILSEGKELPWQRPWRDGYKFKGKTYGPQNFVTGNPYRGANAYMIYLHNLFTGKNHVYFLSKKQVADRGGSIKKGALPLDVWAFIKGVKIKTDEKTGVQRRIKMEGIITYQVYSLFDTENVKPIKRREVAPEDPDKPGEVILEAQDIIDNMPKRPSITNDGGNQAFYRPHSDSVHMPLQKAFKSKEGYYSTLFHELVHSTGHEKRLKREFGATKGSKKYAFEELIAELGAAYLCGVTKIEYFTLNNSAVYLKGWASHFRSELAKDKTFFFRAVLSATRAAKYIIGTTLEKKGTISEGVNTPVPPAPVSDRIKKPAKRTENPHKRTEKPLKRTKVKASVGQAVKDLVGLPKYKHIGEMALQMLFTAQKNSDFPKDNEGLKGKIFEKLENQGFAEFDNDRGYFLTDEGLELYKKIQGRLDTLKAKKEGTDMFPDLAGVKNDPGLEVIQRYVTLHGQTLGAEHLKIFIKNLQDHIKTGRIKKDHPYSSEIKKIQDQLVLAYNGLGKSSLFKIHITNLDRYKSIISKELSGLGFLPFLISAAAGKVVEYGIKKAMTKKDPAVKGLGSTEAKPQSKTNILEAAGFIRADQKQSEVKAPGTFRLPGELGKFILDLQPYKLAIAVSGDPHAGKTEFMMQLANAFAEIQKDVAAYMLEQGGLESKDTQGAKERNISPENTKRVHITGEAEKGIETIKRLASSGAVHVIMIDSWQKLKIPATRFDELRQEYPNIIWVVIFQQNGEGGTKGGVSSDFDAPVQLKVRKVDKTFKNNYVEAIKNRGNPGSLTLKYLIKSKKTVSLNKEE